MQSTEKLSQTPLTRQERLLVWMRRKKLTNADIARRLEVGNATVRAWFEAESIPQWRHDALVALGIPAELLPPGQNIAPGPKRKPPFPV